MKNESQTCSVTASQLADKLRQCQTWQEVEHAIATHPEHKTDAWQRLNAFEKSRLKQLKALAMEVQSTESPAPEDAQVFRVGNRVFWRSCPGCLESWNPFVVREVDGDWVFLNWVARPVHRSKLILE
jgi:hypothetical protein